MNKGKKKKRLFSFQPVDRQKADAVWQMLLYLNLNVASLDLNWNLKWPSAGALPPRCFKKRKKNNNMAFFLLWCTKTMQICCNNYTQVEHFSSNKKKIKKITHPVCQPLKDLARGYGEVTRIVCIDNPLTTNKGLTFLPSVLRNSPADTFITPSGSTLAQCLQVLLKRQTSLDSAVDREDGWNNSCCSVLVSSSSSSSSLFFFQQLSHDSFSPT